MTLVRSAAGLILGALLLPTVGCSSDEACAAAPALECVLSVDFRGTTYWDEGEVRLPSKAEPIGTGQLPVCDDNIVVDECGQVWEPTEDEPAAQRVYLVPGFDIAEVIAIRWDPDRAATVLISDDLSETRAEALRTALEPSRPQRR